MPHCVVPSVCTTSVTGAIAPAVLTIRIRMSSRFAPVNEKQSTSPATVITLCVGAAPNVKAVHPTGLFNRCTAIRY